MCNLNVIVVLEYICGDLFLLFAILLSSKFQNSFFYQHMRPKSGLKFPRPLYSCPPDVKVVQLVRSVLEYGSSVWDLHTHGFQEELEKVQNHAVRFVTGNYVFETGSMTGILGQLKWESLRKRRKNSRLILLHVYKGLKGKARIPTDYLMIPKNMRRNQHFGFSDTFS